MNKPFFTADPHYGHKAIIKHSNRPFSTIEEHDETLISNYNSVVGKKDLCYILGDFAWKNHIKYLSRLNGKKILIKGNHDKMSQTAYNQFTEVVSLKEIKINKQKITLCHYPLLLHNGSCHMLKSNSGFLGQLFGHVHARSVEIEKQIIGFDVGVDAWNLKPINFETVKKKLIWMKNKKINNCINQTTLLIDNSRWI